MIIRQRAMQAEDKQVRHEAILDAATRLLERSPGQIASMTDVADEAGLAKGTVYLYFASKEELLLAVHERGIDAFFKALQQQLAVTAPLAAREVLSLAREHIVAAPLFLPLAARCLGFMGQGVSMEAALAFRRRMAGRLDAAGAGLERHFRDLAPGDGVALLRRTYALILGLWQLSGRPGLREHAATADGDAALPDAFVADLDRALLALWNGTIAAGNGRGAR